MAIVAGQLWPRPTPRALVAGPAGTVNPSEGADIVGTPGPFALLLIVPFVLAVNVLASSLPARGAARASAAHVLRAE